MTVRIIVERRIKSGRQVDFEKRLLELRSRALLRRGYVSGETLKDCEDPLMYINISTWENVEAWKRWSANQARVDLLSEIEELLTQPSRTRVCQLIDLPPKLD